MDGKRKRKEEIGLSNTTRESLREINLQPRKVDMDDQKKLVYDLGKILEILQKLQQLTTDVKEDLMADIQNTDMSKFLNEAAESLCKTGLDIETRIEVCFVLHRQHTSFSTILKRVLKNEMDEYVKGEEKVVFMIELFLVGIWEENEVDMSVKEYKEIVDKYSNYLPRKLHKSLSIIDGYSSAPRRRNSSSYFLFNQTLGKAFNKFNNFRSRSVVEGRKYRSFVHNFIIKPDEKKQHSTYLDMKKLKPLLPQLERAMPGLGYSKTVNFLKHQWTNHGCKQGVFQQAQYFQQMISLSNTYNLANTLSDLKMHIHPNSWTRVDVNTLWKALASKWKKSPILNCKKDEKKDLYLYEVKLLFEDGVYPVDHTIMKKSPFEGCNEGDIISL